MGHGSFIPVKELRADADPCTESELFGAEVDLRRQLRPREHLHRALQLQHASTLAVEVFAREVKKLLGIFGNRAHHVPEIAAARYLLKTCT